MTITIKFDNKEELVKFWETNKENLTDLKYLKDEDQGKPDDGIKDYYCEYEAKNGE